MTLAYARQQNGDQLLHAIRCDPFCQPNPHRQIPFRSTFVAVCRAGLLQSATRNAKRRFPRDYRHPHRPAGHRRRALAKHDCKQSRVSTGNQVPPSGPGIDIGIFPQPARRSNRHDRQHELPPSRLALCAHRGNFRPRSAEGELQLPFPDDGLLAGLCRRKLPTPSSFQCDARKIPARPRGFQRRLRYVARGIHFDFHSNLDLALNRAARTWQNLRHHLPHDTALIVIVRSVSVRRRFFITARLWCGPFDLRTADLCISRRSGTQLWLLLCRCLCGLRVFRGRTLLNMRRLHLRRKARRFRARDQNKGNRNHRRQPQQVGPFRRLFR